MYDGPPRPSPSQNLTFPTASEGHRTGFQTKPRLWRKRGGSQGRKDTFKRTVITSPNGRALTVAVVNPTTGKLDIPLSVKGAKLTGAGTQWQITGKDRMDYNEPGKEPKVKIHQATVSGAKEKLSVAPMSVTLFALDAEK